MGEEPRDKSDKTLSYSDGSRVESTILTLPTGVFVNYNLIQSSNYDEQLCLWEPNKGDVQGVLRHKPKRFSHSKNRLDMLFQKIHEKHDDFRLRTDNLEKNDIDFQEFDNLEDALIDSYDKPIGLYIDDKFKVELKNYKKISKRFKDKFYTGEDQYGQKTFPKLKSFVLAGGLYAVKFSTGIALSIPLNDFGKFMTFMSFCVGGIVTSALAGVVSHIVRKTRLENKYCDYDKILSFILDQEDLLFNLKACYNTADDIKSKRKYKFEKEKQIEKINDLTPYLLDACTTNAVSFVCTGRKTDTEVIEHFNWLRGNTLKFGRRKNKEILKQKKQPKTEIKESEKVISKTRTLEELSLEQQWKKDERYEETIDGRYILKEKIGEGECGNVSRAIRIIDDEEVAIKCEKPEKKTLTRRKDLCQKLQKLEGQDNFINTIDSNLEENGNNPAYVVNEFINGVDLRKILNYITDLNSETDEESFLKMENIVSIAKDVANGLNYLHTNGINHFDVKPENIMITKEGVAKIGDCDLGEITETKASMIGSVLSTENRDKVAGTLEYMSPEMRGLVKGPVDKRSDVYSLGKLLSELATNEIISRQGAFDKRDDIGILFMKLVSNCLEPTVKKRLPDMNSVIQYLDSMDSEPLNLKIHSNLEDVKVIENTEEPVSEETSEDKVEEIPEKRKVMIE